LSITHSPTTAYHPEANGLVERLHRRMKDALRARAASVHWVTHLPWVMLGIRSTPREAENVTPAEALYGCQLVLPGQFLSTPNPPAEPFLQDVQRLLLPGPPLPPRHNTPRAATPPTDPPLVLRQATFVFVRHDGHRPPLSPAYDGPYQVLAKSRHTFKLQVGQREEVVSVHRLKPAFTGPTVVPAMPPRRGRPPAARPIAAPAQLPVAPRPTHPD
jgi:hypothetical protein